MKQVFKDFKIVFGNGVSYECRCQTPLEAFCQATLDAISKGNDTTIHRIEYDRECLLRPVMTFN